MTVSELIKELKKMPWDARVFHLWDGAPRTAINLVYESKEGKVVTADYNQYAWYEGRPKDAPSKEEQEYWKTPEPPEDYNEEDDW